MAVVVDGVCVIVNNRALEHKFPGGRQTFERMAPNSTFCTDGRISRVSFMVEADARAFVDRLVEAGLASPWGGGSGDVAVIGQNDATLAPSAWLHVDLLMYWQDGRQFSAVAAWLEGEEPGAFVAPPGWRPNLLAALPEAEVQRDYERVAEEWSTDGRGRVETYKHRQTGKLLYQGRPDPLRVQQRFQELISELGTVEALRGKGQKTAAEAFLERATRLVADTKAAEAGPLLLQGVAARMLERWDVAEAASRAATVLQPHLLTAWLDLTWALASLGRLPEAERAARHAVSLDQNDPAALGNLASVLRERGQLDEALQTITRALELKSVDPVNQAIFNAIRKDLGVPWYKRLFSS